MREHSIGGRKRPEDAGIEDSTLFCLGMKHLMAIDSAVETPILAVYHLRLPEIQDVILQHILHLVSQYLGIHHYLVNLQSNERSSVPR